MPYKNPHPLFNVWWDMLQRCRNPRSKAWKDYGGRGIDVCERWKGSFKAFVADMGERPLGYVLDRADNNGNYEPSNCRWVSRSASQRNRRVTRKVIVDGVEYLAIELAERAGVKMDTILERVQRGLSLERVISPDREWNLSGFSLGGKASGLKQLAKTHCPHGHAYTPDNLLAGKHRSCKTCKRERARARAALAARDEWRRSRTA